MVNCIFSNHMGGEVYVGGQLIFTRVGGGDLCLIKKKKINVA